MISVDDRGVGCSEMHAQDSRLGALRSLKALRASRLDLEAYTPLAAQGFPPLAYLFCSESHSRIECSGSSISI